MTTPAEPLQITYSTGLIQEMIASDEVIVNISGGLQVAPFRNPWNNNAVEALVISDAEGSVGQLMHLAQVTTVSTGWTLTPIVGANGQPVQATGVVCCADTWQGVDAFYTCTTTQEVYGENETLYELNHIWMTGVGTDWTVATDPLFENNVPINNMQICYSPNATNSSGVTMLTAEFSIAGQVYFFLYAGVGGHWQSATCTSPKTPAEWWNSPPVIRAFTDQDGEWSWNGALVVPGCYNEVLNDDMFCSLHGNASGITATWENQVGAVRSWAIAGTVAVPGGGQALDGMVVTLDATTGQPWARPLQNVNQYSSQFAAQLPVWWDGTTERIAMLINTNGTINLYVIDPDQTLWVLNSAADALPQWSPPIALDGPIVTVYADPMPWDCPALFAVDPGGVLHLHYQDPTTGFWATGAVKLSTASQYDITRWRTVACVYDANGNPVPNYPLTVAADSACDVAVGASYYFIDSQTTMQVSTDPQGRATLATVATSLSAPTLTLTAGATTSSTSPAAAVNDYFAGTGFLPCMAPFSGSVLASAKNNSGQPLAPGLSDNGGGSCAPSGDDVASWIQQANQLPSSDTDAAAGDAMGRKDAAGYVMLHKDAAGRRTYREFSTSAEMESERARLGLPGPSMTESVWGDIAHWAGDLWRGIKNAVIEVTNVSISWAERTFTIVMNGIEQAWNWVINTVEDALNAIHALFNWIEAKIDDLINWLKAVFNFGHIWDTKTAFTTAVTSLQPALDDMIGWAQADLPNLNTSSIGNAVAQAMSTASANYGSNSLNGVPALSSATSPPSTNPLPGQTNGSQVSPATVTSHPQATWFHDQVTANPLDTSAFTGGTPAQDWTDFTAALDGAAGAFNNALQSFVTAILSAYNNAGGDIRDLTVDDLIQALQQSQLAAFLEQSGIDLLQALLDAAEYLVDTTFQTLNQPLPDGLVAILYGWVADLAGADAGNPSMLDLGCLLAAAPATVIYSMLNDGAEPFPGGSLPPPANTALVSRLATETTPAAAVVGVTAGIFQMFYTLIDMMNDTIALTVAASPVPAETPGGGPALTVMSIVGPLVITALEWPGGMPPQKPASELGWIAIYGWGANLIPPMLNGIGAFLSKCDKTFAQSSLAYASFLGFLVTLINWAVTTALLIGYVDAGDTSKIPSWETVVTDYIESLPNGFTFLLFPQLNEEGVGFMVKLVLDIIGDAGSGLLEVASSTATQ
jgi:hypothetical protein